jgi:hypothetical protein
MYYLNILINKINDQYHLKLIQTSFCNNINYDNYVYFDKIKSSNKFSKMEINDIYQDILDLLKNILISCKLIHFTFFNNCVINKTFIKLDCNDDNFNIMCIKLEKQFDIYQTLYEYIDIPIDSEYDNNINNIEESDESDHDYY